MKVTKRVDISTLHEWKDNPRNISPKDFERLKGQITKLGQYKPLLVTTEGEVIGGNMRLKAYRELGIKDVWVSVVEPKDDNEKLEYALSDNDRAGYYDDDMLANLIPNYDIDWSQYAVDMKPPQDIQALVDSIAPVEEDEAPEVAEGEAISKLGEVYQLGRHRLMCGDATKIEDVEKLMDGKKSDMVFTDPPYNVDYGGEQSPIWKKSIKKIENDNLTPTGWIQFCEDTATIISTYNNGSIYVCHAPGPDGRVIATVLDNIFHWSATIIWKKDRLIPGRGHFQRQYEPIWYGWKGEHKEQSDRTATDVWEIKRPFSNNLHPTMKPIELVSKAIMYSSYENQTVLDIFGGSGSTLIACEQTNRICYMMELDEKYCDVIRKRYYKFIGKEEEWKNPSNSQK